MPTKAFLHKKSLLDQFKDDYKSTGYIQSARAEHTWSNPLTRRKRTNKLNGWIKSFQGKRHVHKLARFNAMQNENLEEAMSLKGFLSNIGDKLVNKYGLDKNKVQNYLGSHTQEMQELLDDKDMSLKDKAEFVRDEIGGKDEANKSSRGIPEKTLQTVMANLVCIGKPGKAMQNYTTSRRREIFDELEKRGWLEPNSITPSSKGKELAKDWVGLCQESKKSEQRIMTALTYLEDLEELEGKKARDEVENKILTDYYGFEQREDGEWYDPADNEMVDSIDALDNVEYEYAVKHFGQLQESKKSESLSNKQKMEELALSEGAGVSPYLVDIAHKILSDEYGWTASTKEEVAEWLGDHKQAFEHAYGQALRSSDDDKANVRAGIEAALDEEERGVMDAEIAMMGESKEPAEEKLGYEKGHKNSKGEDAPWVIRSHKDNRVLASFPTKKKAEDQMQRMKQYSKTESKKSESTTTEEDAIRKAFKSIVEHVPANVKKHFDEEFVNENMEALLDLFNGWFKFDDGEFVTTVHIVDPDNEHGDYYDDEDEAYQWNACYNVTDGIIDLLGWEYGEETVKQPIQDALFYDFIGTKYVDGPYKPKEYEAYVDNSDTAKKDYVERVISAVQDYYGYSLFNAKNLVQSNYKKVLSWYESGKVDAVEAARCLGGNCEPTKKSEGIHLDFEDTIRVPEWLWTAYMLNDTTDLEEDEIEKLNNFREKYKNYHLDDKSDDPYFSSRNDFDELGGNVYDVDVYKMSDEPTEKNNESIKDFPTNTGYKFTFGFLNPKTVNVAMNVAKEKGYACEQDKDCNVSIWINEPQDAIRFADAIVNVANGENGVSLERSDVDKAFALAVKNNAGYKENKDAIDTAASQYALSIRPTESFDGLFILGELTDAVDFLEEIK